jgi:lysophospholipase L1-like esterase
MGILSRVTLLACSLAIGLLISEGVFRFADIAPRIEVLSSQQYKYSDDPRIGWEPLPLAERKRFRTGVNALGYRDLDHPVPKPPGVLRIAVIGDSIAQGTGIEDEKTIFPRVLEMNLRLKGAPAEVQNFGVPGYNTQQEVATLVTKGLAYSPDVVVLAYCLNDRSFEAGQMPQGMARTALQTRATDESRSLRWLAQSAMFRYVYFGLLFEHVGAEDEMGRQSGGVFADTVKQSFELLAELARTHDFRVIVSIFPLFRRKKAEDFEGYAFRSEHAYVRTLSEQNGFVHLDLLERFQACAKEGPVAMDAYHPNERGHRCAAEALARQVEEMRPMVRQERAPGNGGGDRAGDRNPGGERRRDSDKAAKLLLPGGSWPLGATTGSGGNSLPPWQVVIEGRPIHASATESCSRMSCLARWSAGETAVTAGRPRGRSSGQHLHARAGSGR